MSQKAELRSDMLARRRLRVADVAVASSSVCERLRSLPEVSRAPTLAAYMRLPGEVDLGDLLRWWLGEGRALLLPRFEPQAKTYAMVEVGDLSNEVTLGRYGIVEPVAQLPVVGRAVLASADVTWLVPGVAFDQQGRRLGRGGGYYDRLLARAKGAKLGVALDWQVLPLLPSAAHDVRMNLVVTESRVLRAL